MSKDLWTAVDRYLNEALMGPDPVLDAALEANAAAGLPAIDVAPNQGKFLSLLAQIAGARRIDVVWAGKAGTLALMIALPMFLIADAAHSVRTVFQVLGWAFAIGGIVLGYFAAAKYVPAARAALREGRTARPAAEVSS